MSSQPLALSGPCLRFDPETMRQSGAVALWRAKDGLRVVSDRGLSGDRLWHNRPKPKALQVAGAGQ